MSKTVQGRNGAHSKASKRRKKRRKKHPQKAAKPDFKRDCRITVFMIKYTLSNL